MKFSEYKYLILSDLYRITGNVSFADLFQHVRNGEGFKYVFWMRTEHYLYSQKLLRVCFYPLARFFLNRLKYKLSISISPDTQIGSGFFIGHFGGIVVNELSIIGKNCNLSHGVTIGQANRGKKKGYPELGDNIYIGPGAKIIGSVKVGNNVCIGTNCVVTNDVPDNAVVVGIPAKVISYEGSIGYVNKIDYDGKIS